MPIDDCVSLTTVCVSSKSTLFFFLLYLGSLGPTLSVRHGGTKLHDGTGTVPCCKVNSGRAEWNYKKEE